MAAKGADADTRRVQTPWGIGQLGIDGTFVVDEGWQFRMQDIRLAAGCLLTDPWSRHGGANATDWTCLSSTLWHCSRLCWLTHGDRKNKTVHKAALQVISVILVQLTRGLIMWANKQSEPCTAELLAFHPAHKKIHPVLIARLEKKPNQRSAVREWTNDGLRVKPEVYNLENNARSRYMQETRKTFMNVKIVELILDSTMFAGRDTQLSIAFACDSGVAAYLPPLTHRHLRWRQAAPGDIVNDEDFKRFEQKGWQTLKGLEGQDCIQSINHVLQVGLGKNFSTFKPQETLKSMPRHGVRYWDPTHHRWMRAVAPGSGLAVYELPDSMLDGISALLLTVDQKPSQWGAVQYMADSNIGLGLFTAPRADPYHRSWRDFQFAMTHSQGHFRHSSVQLNMALNVNHQPFGTGAHLSKRQDIKKEWARLLPAYDAEFEALAGKIALDMRAPAPRILIRFQFQICRGNFAYMIFVYGLMCQTNHSSSYRSLPTYLAHGSYKSGHRPQKSIYFRATQVGFAQLSGPPDRAKTCLDHSSLSYCSCSSENHPDGVA